MTRRENVLRGEVEAAVDRFDLDDDERTFLVNAAIGVPRARLARGVNENTFKARIRKLCRKTEARNLNELVIRVLRVALTVR